MGLWGKRADMIVYEADPFNAEPPRAALAGRMLTPADSFYGRNHGPIPVIDPVAWRLKVGGMVARPLEQPPSDPATRQSSRPGRWLTTAVDGKARSRRGTGTGCGRPAGVAGQATYLPVPR